MTERTINGIIEKWGEIKIGTKADKKTLYFQISCVIDSEWHSFFQTSAETAQKVMQISPVGTTVEFVEIKIGTYWNYKAKTWKNVLAKVPTVSSGPTQPNEPTTDSNNKFVDMSVRDKALNKAIVLTGADGTCVKTAEQVIEAAKKFEKYLLGIEVMEEQNDDPNAAIPEEEINIVNQ